MKVKINGIYEDVRLDGSFHVVKDSGEIETIKFDEQCKLAYPRQFSIFQENGKTILEFFDDDSNKWLHLLYKFIKIHFEDAFGRLADLLLRTRFRPLGRVKHESRSLRGVPNTWPRSKSERLIPRCFRRIL